MINVCMDCGYEWENDTHSCLECGSGNFAVDWESK